VISDELRNTKHKLLTHLKSKTTLEFGVEEVEFQFNMIMKMNGRESFLAVSNLFIHV